MLRRIFGRFLSLSFSVDVFTRFSLSLTIALVRSWQAFEYAATRHARLSA